MNFIRTKRPNFHGAYFTLAEVAEKLRTSTDDLLAYACSEKLQLFCRVPDGVIVYSVHEDAIDLQDVQAQLTRTARRVPPPEPGESYPISMSVYGIDGLILTHGDCRQIRDLKVYRKCLFTKGCNRNGAQIDDVLPLKGRFEYHDKQTLRKDGWCLAVYPQSESTIQFKPGDGYIQPQGVDLSIADLFVTAPALRAFLDRLDIDVFLAELFVDGDVVVERPAYFSEKLNYLIDAAEKFWRKVNKSEIDKIKERRRLASEFLKKSEFSQLFIKGEASDKMRKAAEDFITPVFTRADVNEADLELYPTYLTPEIKALIAAAKWFWGAPTVLVDEVRTHPQVPDIIDFLRDHGLKDDQPKYAATILRPEAAARGRPVEIPVPPDLRRLRETSNRLWAAIHSK